VVIEVFKPVADGSDSLRRLAGMAQEPPYRLTSKKTLEENHEILKYFENSVKELLALA
jgi:hypothetical protein